MRWQMYERLTFELRHAIAQREALFGARAEAILARASGWRRVNQLQE